MAKFRSAGSEEISEQSCDSAADQH